MVDKVSDALAHRGIQDRIVAAAMFFPRGQPIGGDLGDRVGGLSDGLGAAATAGLPERILVGVSATSVYGFGTRRTREHEPTDLMFRLRRAQLDVRVERRMGVRVVELYDPTTGAHVELEGARMPGFHVGDVLHALGV
jgi:hypothetical protein